MYDTLVNMIQYGEYTTDEITERIDRMYAECRITAEQRADLLAMVPEYIKPPAVEVPDMLSALVARVEALEAWRAAQEGGETPKYPAWTRWDGLSKLPGKGDIVSHNGKLWRSRINLNSTEPGTIGTALMWEDVTEEVS